MPDLSDPATPCRTLIVEDDPDSREALSKALRVYGYEASCAGTFFEAVAKLTPYTRWLILDLRLPDGDGSTLLRYIREHELPIKVAVVTGAEEEALLADTVLLKPDAFFTKPIDFADVATWLASAHLGPDGCDGFAGTHTPA